MMKAALALVRPLHGNHHKVITILQMPHGFDRIALSAAHHHEDGPDKNHWLLFMKFWNERSCQRTLRPALIRDAFYSIAGRPGRYGLPRDVLMEHLFGVGFSYRSIVGQQPRNSTDRCFPCFAVGKGQTEIF